MSSRSDSRAGAAGAIALPPPRRRWRGLVTALTALGATAGLLLFAARDVLRAERLVQSHPVIIRAATPTTPEPDGAADAPEPAGGRTVQAPGWLEADPFAVACTALADGVVESMLVLEGQSVEAGQIVARLVSDDARLDVAAAEARLRSAEARRDAAAADLVAAETDWTNPVERTRAVAVARAAIAMTNADLARLPALVATEQATLRRLEDERDRSRAAHAAGATNDFEVIRLEQDAIAQAARVEATEAMRAGLLARRQQEEAELAAAEAHLALRITEHRALALARAGQAEAEAAVVAESVRLDEARLRLERMVIHAPISGRVQRRFKAPGSKVMLGMDDPESAQLLQIYDPEHLQVRVDVPLADAAEIRIGQRCDIVVDVLPDRTFAGEVTRITHEADLQKNTLQVKVRLIEVAPVLRPEMLARVRFIGAADRTTTDARTPADDGRTILVPAAAVSESGSGTRVWTIVNRRGRRGEARDVPVTARPTEPGWMSVRGDLHEGDLVILGATDLHEGARVRIGDPS